MSDAKYYSPREREVDSISFTTATGGQLNSIGIAFRVIRQKGETDAQYRIRIEEKIRQDNQEEQL